MFRMRLTINQALLQKLRDIPERAQRNLRQKVQTQLKSELQSDVDSLMETPPGEPSSPFEFASDASRGMYFILLREFPDMSDGRHYIRTGDTASSFEVVISDKLRESLISIVNPKTVSGKVRKGYGTALAKYIYGPWESPGHLDTGYPQQALTARERLTAKAKMRIVGYWQEANSEELRGIV